MVAQQFALQYPQFLSNLILLATSAAGGRNVPFMKQITKQWFKSSAKLAQITDRKELKRLSIESLLFTLGPLYDRTDKHNMDRIEDYMDMSLQLRKPIETSMTQLKAISKWNGIDKLEQLDKYSNRFGFNIVLIHGDQDNVCDLRNTIFMNQRLTNSKIHILKGVGHTITFDINGRDKLIDILENTTNNNSNAIHSKL